MKGFKRIISFFMAFAMVCTIFVLPVKADYSTSTTDTLWGSYIRAGVNSVHDVPIIGTLLGYVVGASSGRVCAASDDQLHHADSYESCAVDKDGTPYVSCICKYCGDRFKAVASDLSAAYDDYVTTLPVTGYDSSGKLRYSPVLDYMGIEVSNTRFFCEHSSLSSSELTNICNYSFDCSSGSARIFPASGQTSFRYIYLIFFYRGVAPIDGYYNLLSTPICSGYAQEPGGNRKSFNGRYFSSSSVFYNAGASFVLNSSDSTFSGGSYYTDVFAQGSPPIYEITPVSALSGDTYNINTRPTSITGGNYGIVGDNGQITKVEDNSTIINETNNTYYNPATGQIVPITGWSYDYSDRSYKVTMEGGKTSTVTYGDENISITETTVNESGDTITNNYTIYYLIDGSGSENPPCEHDWQESSSSDPTCTLPGKVTLSCTKCQQTKTETIPALGHNWQVKQTVTTQYDEEGNLTQQGYTIFECSTCHEQYKSPDGTMPPGGNSGGSTTEPGVSASDKM